MSRLSLAIGKTEILLQLGFELWLPLVLLSSLFWPQLGGPFSPLLEDLPCSQQPQLLFPSVLHPQIEENVFDMCWEKERPVKVIVA